MIKPFFIAAICLLMMCCNADLFSQAPDIQWQKSLGGTGFDIANAGQATTDGGYIVAGYTYSTDGNVTGSHGDADFWVVKLDASGNLQWQKALGGSAGDFGYSVQQTSDDSFIVAGSNHSTDGDITGNHGDVDCWVVKLSATGALQWQQSLGGTGAEYAGAIRQTTDGGYIMAGTTYSNDGQVSGNHGGGDAWIVKLDGEGSLQWQKTLGGSAGEDPNAIQQTSDGGYIVAGTSSSNDGDVTGNHGADDFWIVKLDGVGTIQWQESLGGSDFDSPASVQHTSDGGYIVAGDSYSTDGNVTGNHGNVDFWVVKLSNSGTLEWQKMLGGTAYDKGSSVQQIAGGGYIVTGETESNDGNVTGNHGQVDSWVVNLSDVGVLKWQKAMGGTQTDHGSAVQQTVDNGYFVAGYSYSTDGDVTGNHGSADFWVVRLMGMPVAVSNENLGHISIFPNPSKDFVTIDFDNLDFQNMQLAILNAAGQVIREQKVTDAKMTLDISRLTTGTYFLRISKAGVIQTTLMIMVND